MDSDLKAYLDTNFSQVHTRIEGVEKTMQATIRPIEQTMERHTHDIADLYNRDRQQVGVCESHREKTGNRVQNLEAWKTAIDAQSGSKRWRTEQVVVVVVGTISLVGGVVIAVLGV